ncbi:substrate-binding periplasmic protein [Streptomyces sp. BRA346]|uniref:substrate-binding periplasmic protein n=1 Tax=Streptomyces sp. BRA346 TaxID=2878199 RepID=UPI00406451E5
MRTPRRSLLVGAVTTALLLPLTACGGDSDAADAGAAKYKNLVRPGVITAATVSEQPPFAVTDESGKPSGFAIDLMNKAAKRLGVKVQYKATSLQGALTGLTANQYDIGVGGFIAAPERRKQVGFTTPYYWGFTKILTQKGDKQTKLSDFDGKRVGVVSGSVQEDYMDQRMPDVRKVNFKDHTALVTQLLSKSVDAAILGGGVADTYAAKSPVRIAVTREAPQGTAFPIRKNGDPKLRKDIDAQIDAMIDDGTYLKLYKKYFQDPVSADLIKERPGLAKQVENTSLAPSEK